MQRSYGQFHVLVVDDDGGLDLAGADHLDVDALFRQSAEHQAGYAHMATHADANDGHLADLVVRDDIGRAHGGADLRLEQVQRTGEVVAVYSEREVGGAGYRLVLQDHVYIDIGGGNRAKDGVSHARGVGDGQQGYFGFVTAEGDARYNGTFHFLIFLESN